ncbi:uncharacterized protein LY79DRAFT_335474 [Colletotrichum navitas]|uniref:Uncharacterized protein n=1 Tax=Colletotrichum navitas TaxID=681940 RepID=A0AAD8PT87_9PEZI|nr:uncharacterized protein LY79DRAFT_335474 [Colletotrichum navitas]KAK1579795.1 hypothetical protein LY79DRAFT_335474 [Colletotrichum navitas]
MEVSWPPIPPAHRHCPSQSLRDVHHTWWYEIPRTKTGGCVSGNGIKRVFGRVGGRSQGRWHRCRLHCHVASLHAVFPFESKNYLTLGRSTREKALVSGSLFHSHVPKHPAQPSAVASRFQIRRLETERKRAPHCIKALDHRRLKLPKDERPMWA